MNNIGLPAWVKIANGSKSFPCPHCGGNTAVGDSRPSHNGIRRRRYCKCGNRFSTYETEREECPKSMQGHIEEIAAQFEEIEIRLAGIFRAITAAYAAFDNEGATNGADIGKHAAREPLHPDAGIRGAPGKDQGFMDD